MKFFVFFCCESINLHNTIINCCRFFIVLFNSLAVGTSSNGNLKLQPTNQPLSKFWINVQNTYIALARKGLKKLLAFATTYPCETGFSHNVLTKTKSAYITGMQSWRF